MIVGRRDHDILRVNSSNVHLLKTGKFNFP